MPRTLLTLIVVAAFAGAASAQEDRDPTRWPVHDESRPQPQIVAPPTASTQEEPGRPPSDAVVLFNGEDLSEWESNEGGAARWAVKDGYFHVVPGTGYIHTKRGFGDVQLHVEWSAPNPARGTGQDRGNSGVYLMGKYEVQVLDSYGNQTYPDGQAAAVYGQYPPLVNAMRPPGEWNVYDIVFRRPRFDSAGKLVSPAYFTVFHNGILVQDHVELTGPSSHRERPPYAAHEDRLPIFLQDHDHPTRYRNIWLRELE